MSREDLLNQLLHNFLNVTEDLKSVFVFDRDGLAIASATRTEKTTEDEILGAITGVLDSVLDRIGREYNLGQYGSGSFETEEFRLIFAEAGKKSILLCVSNFELTLNEILPYAFLVSEKVSCLIENQWHEDFTVNVPDLTLEHIIGVSSLHEENGEQFSVTKKDGGIVNFNVISPDKKTLRYKVIILGEAAVGKTSLVERFAHDSFKTDYRPTLGISITEQQYHILGSENAKVEFVIWDLAGQKYFKRARKAYVRGAQAAFLVFDVTNRDTFEAVQKWYDDIRDEVADIPFILIGNKVDLLEKRAVSSEDAKDLALKLRCSYIETSALTGENVPEAFQLLGIGLFFRKD